MPVVLERPSLRSGFSLRAHDDETRINTTLLEMLRQDFALRFPALEAERPPEDESGLDVQSVLDGFRARLRDLPGWEVTDDVALTNLSFTTFLMWKDFGAHADALRRSAVARRLMDGPAGAGPPEPPDAGAATDDLLCPLEADSSQLRAVAAVASGQSFVLIGPPGAGKSQTIANIIVNTLAHGRSVLFVAEKRPALEVVQRRLQQVGLGDFCLDLFSARTSKAAVLEQLSRAQQAQAAFDPQDWHGANDAVAALRVELDGYVQELHRPGRNGFTPFRAIGRVLRAEADAVPDIAFAWADADTHDADGIRHLAGLVDEAAATRAHLGEVVSSPLIVGIGATEWSPSWQASLLEAAGVAAARLSALPDAAAAAAQALALPSPAPSQPAIAALDALAGVLLERGAAESAWALAAEADEIVAAVAAEAARAGRHRELRAALVTSWLPAVMDLPLVEVAAAWRRTSAYWAIPCMPARRGLRQRLAAAACGKLPKDCAADLGRLAELQQIEAAVAASAGRLHAALGARWAGLETDFARLDSNHAWARRLCATAVACTSDPASLLALRAHLRLLVGEAPDMLARTGTVGAALVRLRAAWADTRASLRALAPLCVSDPAAILTPARPDWAQALAAHLRGWADGAALLRDWCTWRGVV